MSSRSLVTGGVGFIGSHVAEHLLRQGHEVIVLDDLSGGSVDNVPDGARLQVGSVLDVELVETLFRRHGFDYVFHLAAYAAEGLSHFIKRFNYENNLVGTVNLINGADTPHSVMHLATAVAEAMGVPPRIEYLAARREVAHAYCDHSACWEVFGRRPVTPLEAGLARMADWARGVGPRASRPFEGIEIARDLPPSWRDALAEAPIAGRQTP